MFCTEIDCTMARVSNVQAVKDILDRYWCAFQPSIETDSAGIGILTMPICDSFPTAVNKDDWPDDEAGPDDSTWIDAMYYLLLEIGDEGFDAMLGELAPYLLDPLEIIFYESVDEFCEGASHWKVSPASPHVQVQEENR